MKINCIIVDDEPASQEILEKYVADCSCLNLVETCKNSFEAIEIINNIDIQLIFLDINMPKLSGMKFYRSLINPPFVICEARDTLHEPRVPLLHGIVKKKVAPSPGALTTPITPP